MGGQACILYGGAEFSRDIDFAIAASPADLKQHFCSLPELVMEEGRRRPLRRELEAWRLGRRRRVE